MKLLVLLLLVFGLGAESANLRFRLDGFSHNESNKDVRNHSQFRESQQTKSPTVKLVLTNHNGVQYTGPVSLGNQELQAIYDTGSFEVLAVSRQCSVCELQPVLRPYDSSASDTFRHGSATIENHHFAGGIAKARRDFETVQIGGANSMTKVPNMPFWQVVETDMKVFLSKQANFVAVVGLGHRDVPPDSDSESLIERTAIQTFSICLLPGLANPGYLTYNPSHNFADSAFRTLEVVGENHWAVNVDDISTDLFGTPLHSCWTYGGQHPCVAVIDSGTSLIGVPPDATVMVKTLIKRIRYDCSNLDELPDLVFSLDGKRFALPARAYTVHFGLENGKPSRCLPAFTDVSMSLKGANVWILGLPFLRHFYTVFDRSGPSIHVADQTDNCEPAVAGNAAFIQSSISRRQPPHPTIANLSEALLPSWMFAHETHE